MADEPLTEVSFRPSKRCKVARKPTYQDSTEDAASPSIGEPQRLRSNHEFEYVAEASGGVAQVQRRGGARKLGISFSSNESARMKAQSNPHEERALVPVGEDSASDFPTNDRFVKPTGRVGVTDDRHMMAYVDSRLAEARSLSNDPARTSDDRAETMPSNTDSGSDVHRSPSNDVPIERPRHDTGETTLQKAQERSRSVYQRPTKRRPPPPRPEHDIARDSMIDQLMGENQVPIYDRSMAHSRAHGAQGVDSDLAAAEEFKSQLLADLERNNKRRPPKIAATATTGPKLGGSRAQREKMRALEESKTNVGKKSS